MNQRFDIIAQAHRVANAVADWARGQTDIRGLAIIGSHARGEARPDSDIDLTPLALDPEAFRMCMSRPGRTSTPLPLN